MRVVTRACLCLLGEGAPELSFALLLIKVLPVGVKYFYENMFALGLIGVYPDLFLTVCLKNKYLQ